MKDYRKICDDARARLSQGTRKIRSDIILDLQGDTTRWTASVVAISLASFPGVTNARTDCEAIPRGPERTDCYLALSQFCRAQSDLAAVKARTQSDAA
jgi:hypothetical protein